MEGALVDSDISVTPISHKALLACSCYLRSRASECLLLRALWNSLVFVCFSRFAIRIHCRLEVKLRNLFSNRLQYFLSVFFFLFLLECCYFTLLERMNF